MTEKKNPVYVTVDGNEFYCFTIGDDRERPRPFFKA